MSKTRLATPHMALDERDYMRERAAAQHSEWLGERSPPQEPPPSPGATTGGGNVLPVIGTALLAIAGYWVFAQRPTPTPAPEATQPTRATEVKQLLRPEAATHAPTPLEQPPVVEPSTYVAAPWREGDETGRLQVSVSSRAASMRVRLTRDGTTWEAFARRGETASIELVPGIYSVEVVSYETGEAQRQPISVEIQHPGQTPSISVAP